VLRAVAVAVRVQLPLEELVRMLELIKVEELLWVVV
jgi:hypothetical protein